MDDQSLRRQLWGKRLLLIYGVAVAKRRQNNLEHFNDEANCWPLGCLRRCTMIRLLLFSSAFLLTENLSAQDSSAVLPLPVSLWEVQVDSSRVIYGRGPSGAMVPTCHFYLRCTLSPTDSTFWQYGLFKIAYTLPSGDTHEYSVSSFDLRAVDGGFAEVCFVVMCRKDGWADFTLASKGSHTNSNLYAYDVHSNFRQVLLRCHE